MKPIFPYLCTLSLSIYVTGTLGHDHSQVPLATTTPDYIAIDGTTELLELHKNLVEIESVVGNEYEVGQYLIRYLSAHNFTVETQKLPPLETNPNKPNEPRLNVFAYKGDLKNTRLLVTSHMDTVTPFFPYQRPDDEQICGRGSNDAKGSIASQIRAVEELHASGNLKEGDVGLLYVVGEEVNGGGMKKANDLFHGHAWEAVIFGEPSDNKLVLGHKGALIYEIKAHGKAAHSSRPDLGINANSMLIRALTAIDAMELPGSERLGNTTTNIGVMQGGVAMNIIPAEASATVLTRIAAGTPQQAMDEIEKVLKDLGEERLSVSFGHNLPPVVCDVDIDGMYKSIRK
ncbi:hypothetical protein CJF31_00000514 [Rutstroemia sp. NJR-2017a BVV2]|nr:hypothetical protein CJF31_00000514 [Rutstroemia sp. NJR-2017a BVV2]